VDESVGTYLPAYLLPKARLVPVPILPTQLPDLVYSHRRQASAMARLPKKEAAGL
jgi:hypothetical protein